MTEQRPPRVFISYSHDSADHAARVLKLANDLRGDGVDAIIDQYFTSPPEGWPPWMEAHIREDDFVVMVCTETYYRRVVHKEKPGIGLGVAWEGSLIYNRIYREKGNLSRFVPVLLNGGSADHIPDRVFGGTNYPVDTPGGYEGLLRRLFNRPAADMPLIGERPALPQLPTQWTTRPVRMLHGVPDLPPNFVPRPEDLAPLKALLLADDAGAIGITSGARRAGLLGMGGIGKSVLAAALARDESVRARFPDGVFWLAFGREALVTRRQAELAKLLGEAGVSFETWQEGRTRLAQLTDDRAGLVVLDDLWQPGHAEAFGRFGPRMGVLLTTRDQAVLEKVGARVHRLDLLSKEAARDLLRESAGWPGGEPLPAEADEIAKECGFLPLALSVTGALIRSGRFDWAQTLARLKAADIKRLRAILPEYEHESVLAALQFSVEALPEREQRAFGECAVLPKHVAVPEAALITLLSSVIPDPLDAEDALQLFVERCLMRRDEERAYLLHDLYHDYLRGNCPDLPAAHYRFVDAYRTQCLDGWASGPRDGYFFRYLPLHLAQAQRYGELRDLLLDPSWIAAKLVATDLPSLLGDYAQASDPEVALVGRALILSAHVIGRDSAQLPGQLTGRLQGVEGDGIARLLDAAGAAQSRAWLRPRTRSLAPPGPELRRFVGHKSTVTSIAVLADGRRALSGSLDRTMRLWDLGTGAELRRLVGHEQGVTSVAVLADGRRALSGSDDKTLRLWDLESGAELRRFVGHEQGVTSVAVLADGRRALSGSDDKTLRLWDLESGAELRRFVGHEQGVTSVAVLADGRRALSASLDATLRLWDLESGAELSSFPRNPWPPLQKIDNLVRTCAVLDGRRALAASWNSLRLWDLEGGDELRSFKGHEGHVTAVAFLPDGRRALSGSKDKTLRLWDLETGDELRKFEGHEGYITALAFLPDGRRALSGSEDGTLTLWDLERRVDVHRFQGHELLVRSVVALPDGRRALSGSGDNPLRKYALRGLARLNADVSGDQPDDRTLRLWDLASGAELRRFWGPTYGGISSIAVLPNGRRALCGSTDAKLWLCDLESGTEYDSFMCDGGEVWSIAILPDGRRALSGSWDLSGPSSNLPGPPGRGGVRLWDLDSRAELRRFEGHERVVTSVAVLADGQRALSGSWDRTLRLWDLETGAELRRFEGHEEGVSSVAVLAGSRRALSGSKDKTLRLWDLGSGSALAVFTGDTAITCVAVARDDLFVAGSANGAIHILELIEPKQQ